MVSRSLRRASGLAIVLIAASACGPAPDSTASQIPASGPERCADESDAGAGAVRDIRVGSGKAAQSDFVAYVDGQDVDLLTGAQGGTMITPTVAVPIDAADGKEACWQVDIQNALEDGSAVTPGLLSNVYFERSGQSMEAGPFLDLLGYSPDPLRGKTLTLTVTVTGAGFEGAETLHLHLH